MAANAKRLPENCEGKLEDAIYMVTVENYRL
jgi:hypothetical protein